MTSPSPLPELKWIEENYQLCYCCGCAYFTSDMSKQYGDDWDDAPYEHNAGNPYESNTKIATRIIPKNWEEPDERLGLLNTPYSVDDINAKKIPWLVNKITKQEVFARITIKEYELIVGKFYSPQEIDQLRREAKKELFLEFEKIKIKLENINELWYEESTDSDLIEEAIDKVIEDMNELRAKTLGEK